MIYNLESEDFLAKLRERDREAMAAVVKLYTGPVYNACRGLGFSAADADDVTQSVWLTFFDVVHAFEGRSKLKTFLFGILYNKASEFRKKAKRLEPTMDIEAVVDRHFDRHGHWISVPKDPEKFLEAIQLKAALESCLESLPLAQRMAFHLREVEGEITAEICNILSVTATHLGVLLFRARNQLRECIEKKV